MPKTDKEEEISLWKHPAVQFIVPVLIFIGSVFVLFQKVDDLAAGQQDNKKEIMNLSEKIEKKDQRHSDDIKELTEKIEFMRGSLSSLKEKKE